MNLKKLNLRDKLLELGAEKLTEILGQDRLITLSKLTGKSINEIMMVDLIIKRFGDQIFAEPLLRGYIIHFLRKEYKSYIFNGDPDYNISLEDERNLINAAWDRRFYFHHRLIEIFDLNQSYWPDPALQEDNKLEILPKKKQSIQEGNLFFIIKMKIVEIIKKIINFFKNEEQKNILNLFDFQIRIKEKILNQINQDRKKMIVHMPTGSGKTLTTLSAISELKNTSFKGNSYVVWLSHSDELCDQAKETFEHVWETVGEDKINVYRVTGNTRPTFDEKNGAFIIITYQKLSSMRTGSETQVEILEKIRRKTKIIVADEAHMVPANTFSSSINFLSNLDDTFVIGLTATPGRGLKHKQNELLAEFFGKFKITISDLNNRELDDPIKFLQDQKILAKIKAIRIATNFTFELNEEQKENILNNFDLHNELIKQMAKDDQRNLCIISHIIDLYKSDKSSIVFACSLEHAKLLTEVCILLNMEVVSIDDKTSRLSRKKYIQDFKDKKIKIIINYGVLSTGFDAPNTNAIVITRPTTSPVLYSQMLGRGLRGLRVGGNPECLLLDLKDNLKGLPDERVCFTMFDNYYLNVSEIN